MLIKIKKILIKITNISYIWPLKAKIIMDFVHYLTIFLAPLISLLYYLFLKYKFPGGSFSLVFKSFLFGILCVSLVLLAESIAEYYDWNNLKNLRRVAFYSLIITAFSAELGKFIILRYFILPKEMCKGPTDAIIYSVIISLGFICIWNIFYLFDIIDLQFDLLYAFIIIPANITFAVVMGFFIGLGKIRKNRFIDSMTGLSAATFFHGIFNFCYLTSDTLLLILVSIGISFIAVALAIKSLYIKAEKTIV